MAETYWFCEGLMKLAVGGQYFGLSEGHREGLMKVSALLVALLAAVAFGTSSAPAYAYLDPGTGSMILQLIVGGVAGLALAGRFYWNRLLVLIGVRSEPPADARPEELGSRADR
jgi:hypothetical protein